MDKPKEAEILVTGATGLLGSHVIIELLKSNISIKAIVRDSKSAQQSLRQLFEFYSFDFDQKLHNIQFLEGDLLDFSFIDEALTGIKSIFHCAGLVPDKHIKPQVLFNSHVEATANLVNLSLFHGITWFGHTSSVATLGPNPDGLVDEDYFWKPGKHHSYYSQLKYWSEQEVWRGKEEGLAVFIINPSVLVGPSLFNRGSFQIFNKVAKGLPFYLAGSNGYVDVRDTAAFFVQQWRNKTQGIRVISNAENLEQKHFLTQVAINLNQKVPYLRISKSMFIAAALLERLIPFRKIQLSRDLYKMASSRNAYDNNRSIELGAQYRGIDEAIQNTVRFINFRG